MDKSGNDWKEFGESWARNREKILRPRTAMSQRMVELCELKPGQNLLDFGTGLGEPAFTAAARHPQVQVSGVDISESMIESANQWARAKAIGNFHASLIKDQRLPFEDSYFDAATSSFALEFSEQWQKDLRQIARVLKTGGKFVLATWVSDAGSNPLQYLIPFTIREICGPKTLAQDPMFRFNEGDVLESECRSLGLKLVHGEECRGLYAYDSIEDFWKLKSQASPTLAKDMGSLTGEQLQLVNEAIEKRLQDMKTADTLKVPFCAKIFRFIKERT
jgi:SAM-dependent methyltransferase